jgi:hypothetical protein
MAHFAKIEKGRVTQVIVAEQDHVNTLPGMWVQTSYNTLHGIHKLGGTPLRFHFARVGGHYDEDADVFYSEQPYPSWTLNETTWCWEAPVPNPNDGKLYKWIERTKQWLLVETNS